MLLLNSSSLQSLLGSGFVGFFPVASDLEELRLGNCRIESVSSVQLNGCFIAAVYYLIKKCLFFFFFFFCKNIFGPHCPKRSKMSHDLSVLLFFFLLSKLGFSSFRSNSFGRTIYEVVLTFHGLFFKCQHKAYVISFLSLCSKCKMLFLWIASGDTDRTGEAKEQLQARSERCNSGKEEVPGDQQRWGFLVSLMFLNRIGFMLMSRSGFFFVCLFSVFLCLV